MRRGRPRHPDILTPRQWQVLELLRQGLTNEQIARRLGLTLDGAKYHVSEIITKLGVSSREQAAAWTPEREARRLGALAPLTLLFRKATPGAAAKVAAGAGALVVVGAALLLALALLLDLGPQESGPTGEPGSLGKLAYIRNGDLWVMSLPGGRPVRLTTNGQMSYPRWSPSGEWLLAGETVVRADGGRRRAAPGCVAWSPVADELACVDPAGGFRLEAPTGALLRTISIRALLPGAAAGTTIRGPYWSPDGAKLAYAADGPLNRSQEPYSRLSSLWVANADGTNAQLLYANDAYAGPESGQVGVLRWTPDGSSILSSLNPQFSASIAADGLPLYAISVGGGAPRRLGVVALTRDELIGQFASRTALALTEGFGRETWTRKRIAVVDTASGAVTFLTGTDTAAFSPEWSPDGRQVAYVAGPDIGPVGGGDDARQGAGQRRIWVMDADGANKRQLTDDPAYRDERPLWSRDGSCLLFARIDNAEDVASLWLLPVTDGTPVKVTDLSWPRSAQDPALWFGFYGYIPWDRYFAWWQGS
ncbi:MAG TPA: LuxR C-terminal-related transcriptional regulator [Dehalococcoidia bacterium]|nr:LuxR C-terminal-related transcriptional regulator [Dehalococcoidia bacterium]